MAAVPDADVAGALFARYEQGLYRFCLSRLRSREDAEDAVQTTFVRAVRALERGVRPEVAPAWLFTIARNVCSSRRLAALRRARVETARDLDHVRASALACEDERPDELIGLREALAEMPPKLQRVVLLREWQGLSYGEIGAELGVSQSAVESLLFRARRDLARRLRGLLDLGPLLGMKALLGGATVAAVAVGALDSSVVTRPPPPRLRTSVRAPVAVAVPHATVLQAPGPVARAPRRAPVVGRTPDASPSVVVARARSSPRVAPPQPARVHRDVSQPASFVRPSVPEPAPVATSTSAAPRSPTPVATTAPDGPASTVAAPVEQAASTVTAPVEQAATTVTAPVQQAASTVTAPVEQTASTVAAAVPPAPPMPPPADPSALLPGG